MRVVVVNHVSLDGVMQGPGRADEDTRNGFSQGGWAQQSADDPKVGAALGKCMGEQFSWLFGRLSYEGMVGHWNEVGGPFKDGLNNTTKYVVSSNPDTELRWPNSELLAGDGPTLVAALRQQQGGNLVIMGSGQLIRSLLPRDLIDELFLMIHPLVLGSGQQLFGPADDRRSFTLVDCDSTSTGLILATYSAALTHRP